MYQMTTALASFGQRNAVKWTGLEQKQENRECGREREEDETPAATEIGCVSQCLHSRIASYLAINSHADSRCFRLSYLQARDLGMGLCVRATVRVATRSRTNKRLRQPRLAPSSQTLNNAAPSAEDQKLRADVFERLLSTVDLKKVSREFVLDLSASGCVLSRSEECREHLTNAQSEAWKCFDAPTAVSLKPCADHITGGFTRRGNITDTIYALGRDRESSDVQVIVKLPPPQLQADRNVSVRVPYRDACAVAVFDDSIYMLGGSDDNRDATNQVDRINPLDGSVSSVPSMTLPRRRPSAAATDRHLLVFGGDNGLVLRRIVVETTIQSRKYFQAKAFSVTATKLSPLYTLQLNEIDYVKLEFAMISRSLFT
ncbi:unnamed protein product [Mesocestoides corti]|uniref:Uncharacterized protein n=1 Tax=Mesocestoides corti TaxID=53468 RepID=A0A0R3UQR0_MESCO|nr:unnamed protein product [Mesocestoides corti]